MMRTKQLHVILLFFFAFLSCGQKKVVTDGCGAKENIKLVFQVFPDGEDSYCVEWTDTLGLSENYIKGSANFIKRPEEIWCVVTNPRNDTLGYYKGLSTAQTFTCFSSTDSIISLNFMLGANFFSDKFENEAEATNYAKAHRLPIEYKPIDINLHRDLRHEIEMELECRFDD